MKKELDIASWNRREHFNFFSQFEEPFFGVTVDIDCTKAYRKSKDENLSFFQIYLYQAIKAVNLVEPFRYRICEEKVYIYDKINISTTIIRANGTFGFSYIDYEEDFLQFQQKIEKEIQRTRAEDGLKPSLPGENVVHFSAIPWLDFTSLSQARNFSIGDSCPKISFGKVVVKKGARMMPVSIHVHHGLMDGYHVGLFVEKFQALMNEEL